jgi:hypothetical protein
MSYSLGSCYKACKNVHKMIGFEKCLEQAAVNQLHKMKSTKESFLNDQHLNLFTPLLFFNSPYSCMTQLLVVL